MLQCTERGATPAEVEAAILHGTREPARAGRFLYRYNLPFSSQWQGKTYAIKQVAAIVAEEPEELVVVTVYTFYF